MAQNLSVSPKSSRKAGSPDSAAGPPFSPTQKSPGPQVGPFSPTQKSPMSSRKGSPGPGSASGHRFGVSLRLFKSPSPAMKAKKGTSAMKVMRTATKAMEATPKKRAMKELKGRPKAKAMRGGGAMKGRAMMKGRSKPTSDQPMSDEDW